MISVKDMAAEFRPPVAAGIVNYNGGAKTARALHSLLRQTLVPREIAIVDNASADGSFEALRAEFRGVSQIQFLSNQRNEGFGRAQNQAIRATRAEYYLALNQDAILAPDYIERLVGALRSRPWAGYAAGLIHYCDAQGKALPFVYTAGHWWLRNRTALNRYYRHSYPESRIESREVGGANGCAPLYRRAMLESIDLGGGEYFDETFFLYMEDVDLDWRAHLAGWTCWFEKAASALHEEGAAFDDPDLYAQIFANRWLMILKNDTLGDFLLHLPFILKADLRQFWFELFQRGRGPRAVLRALRGRVGEAWRKRKIVRSRAAAPPKDLRAWMRASLEDLRAFKRYRRAHRAEVRWGPRG